MTDVVLTHERSGAQVRDSVSPEVFSAVAAAGLKPAERAVVLERIMAAVVAERRGEQCAGATYLTRAASDLGTPARIAVTLRRVATSFVRPKQ
jgi:hypothetical protein